MLLLVRNRVKDIEHWKKVFDEQEAAGLAAGLSVQRVWRSADREDEVFFILGVEDRERAEAYMATPEAAAVGEEAGAIEGEFWFLEEFPSTKEDYAGGPTTSSSGGRASRLVSPTSR